MEISRVIPGVLSAAPEPHHWIREAAEEEKRLAHFNDPKGSVGRKEG